MRERPGLLGVFSQSGHVPKLAPCPAVRFSRRHPAAFQFVASHRNVEGDFVVNLIGNPPAADQSHESLPHADQVMHHGDYAVRMTCVTAAAS